MVDNIDAAMKRAADAIRDMRRIPKDETQDQARARVCATIAVQKEFDEAARYTTMIDTASVQRMNGNGHAQPVIGEATSLSPGVINALAEGMVPFLREFVAEALSPLKERIAELEVKPGLTYQGVWAAEKVYSVGDFVTDHGSLWHCWDTNVGVRPGSSDTWQLAVQRGRDAKGKGAR